MNTKAPMFRARTLPKIERSNDLVIATTLSISPMSSRTTSPFASRTTSPVASPVVSRTPSPALPPSVVKQITYKSKLLLESTTLRTSGLLTCAMYLITEFLDDIEARDYYGFIFKQPEDNKVIIDEKWFLFEKSDLTKLSENPSNTVLKRRSSFNGLNGVNYQSSRVLFDFVITKIISSCKNEQIVLTLNPMLEEIKLRPALMNSQFLDEVNSRYSKYNLANADSELSTKVEHVNTALAEIKRMNKDIKRQMLVIRILLSSESHMSRLKRVLRLLIKIWRSRRDGSSQIA